MSKAEYLSGLHTARLWLRAWRVEDALKLRRAIDESDAHLRPWIPFMQHEPRTLQDTQVWLASMINDHQLGKTLRYGLWVGENLMGEVMLIDRVGPESLELGYWIHRDAVGRGFATEAARALVSLALTTLRKKQVELHCDPRNAASLRVAAKLGARRARVERSNDTPPIDLEVWIVEEAAPG